MNVALFFFIAQSFVLTATKIVGLKTSYNEDNY